MAALGLEVWLIGTRTEVDAALSALAEVGRLAGASKPDPLFGEDAGRIRRYVRVKVPTSRADRPDVAAGTDQNVIDLDSRRRTG